MHHFDCRRELSSVGPAVVLKHHRGDAAAAFGGGVQHHQEDRALGADGPGCGGSDALAVRMGMGQENMSWRPLAAARELGWAVLEKCDLARHSRVALPGLG